jgi:subtilase family serine protease
MNFRNLTARTSWPALALLALAPLAPRASALAEHNVANGLQLAVDHGTVDSGKEQSLTVVLKLHNQAAFDQAVKDLYDPESASYHKWFTDEDFAKFAPTAAELKTVKDELVKQGFTVLSVDPLNFSLRVHGTTETVERAFQTQLHTFTYKNDTFQAHVRDAQLTGEAGPLVDSVSGLDRHQVRPQLSVAKNPFSGKGLYTKRPITKSLGSELLGEISGTPLSKAATSTYDTPGASLPVGSYYGNVYDVNPSLIPDYTPAQLQAHYGLPALYKQGYDGAGQTIALVEGYGYPAALSDANAAAKIFGLPALTSATFEEIFPEGKPVANAGYLAGWNIEIALDIQSAHAIAPGARILEVATSGQDNEDFIASLQYIISHKLANTVSNSWEEDTDIISGPAENGAYTAVLERGAAAGISFQFSSGDGGDGGLGSPIGAPGVPSNNPYATAVGGTSILNRPSGAGEVVAGWGTDVSFLNLDGPLSPPEPEFLGGAGGGESVMFAKPWWQHDLPGSGRQVPDVSALADPYTGFPLVVSELTSTGPVQYAEPGWAGTSLASPIFTAVWAIADQYNGKPLGQASPLVAKLKAGQITDVLPTSALNSSDVTGKVYTSSGKIDYSAAEIFADASEDQTQTKFPSAIWNFSSSEGVAIAFGLDSSLTVTSGWDNVTGFGEPNGLPFIQGVTGKTKGAAVPK